MLDSKKFAPPIEVVQARREAILTAAREAQAQKDAEHPTQVEIPSPVISVGFPISFATASHPLSR